MERSAVLWEGRKCKLAGTSKALEKMRMLNKEGVGWRRKRDVPDD